MKRPLFVRLASLLVLLPYSWGCPVVCAHAQSDDLAVKLSKRVHNYSVGPLNFVGTLVRVSNDFQIPMGIVWINTPTALAERSFTWKDATVEQLIEAIAKMQPGYQVRATNGMVHIFAPGAILDPESFLRLQIKSFRVEGDLTELASLRLHNLITPPRYSGFSAAANMDPRINLDLRDSTVEGVLDALVLASSKRKIWVVTFLDSKAVTPKGFRRTISLWADKPAPDEDQPVWDLLRWGDPMPPAIAAKK